MNCTRTVFHFRSNCFCSLSMEDNANERTARGNDTFCKRHSRATFLVLKIDYFCKVGEFVEKLQPSFLCFLFYA
uniref:Secreted protein n=1 Tax=Ascaris lumbricoides TaxID=6252 RepID=A0A0M3I3A0_ASCLU